MLSAGIQSERASAVRLDQITKFSARILLGGVFLFAAVTKTYRPAPFVSVVDTLLATSIEWPGEFKAQSIVPISVLVIVWEAFLGLLLISGVGRRGVALATGGTLILFSSALVRLMFLPETPACGCFGAFPRAVEDARGAVQFGLIRNAALLWLAVWLGMQKGDGAAGRGPAHRASGAVPGYSIVEILVCIVIIAVLIAIALPVFRHAREKARLTESLSALRQLLASVDVYASDHRELFPFLGVPGHPERGLERFGPRGASFSYFGGSSKLWATALVQSGHSEIAELAGETRLTESLRESFGTPDVIGTYFRLTHVSAADPGFWEPGGVPSEPMFFRAVGRHEVGFPSGKGLLVDVHEDVFNETSADVGWNVGSADGAASFRARTPVVHTDLHRPYGAIPWSVLTTRRGIRGRDW